MCCKLVLWNCVLLASSVYDCITAFVQASDGAFMPLLLVFIEVVNLFQSSLQLPTPLRRQYGDGFRRQWCVPQRKSCALYKWLPLSISFGERQLLSIQSAELQVLGCHRCNRHHSIYNSNRDSCARRAAYWADEVMNLSLRRDGTELLIWPHVCRDSCCNVPRVWQDPIRSISDRCWVVHQANLLLLACPRMSLPWLRCSSKIDLICCRPQQSTLPADYQLQLL